MLFVKNFWHKLLNSVAALSIFVMLLSPVAVGRVDLGARFTPAGCEEGEICSI